MRPRKFSPGQKVLLPLPASEDKSPMRWQGTYIVWKCQGHINYIVELPLGVLKTFHVNLLKVWIEDEGVGTAYG